MELFCLSSSFFEGIARIFVFEEDPQDIKQDRGLKIVEMELLFGKKQVYLVEFGDYVDLKTLKIFENSLDFERPSQKSDQKVLWVRRFPGLGHAVLVQKQLEVSLKRGYLEFLELIEPLLLCLFPHKRVSP